MASFKDKLGLKWNQGKFVCIGLDQDDLKSNKVIIDQTFDLVCSYKLNSAFYEAEGITGWESLKKTVEYIHQKDPDILVILDSKKGDIANTNKSYAKSLFDNLDVDAITVNPYLGKESLQPFLERLDKGIFVLVKTSNPGSEEFQDLMIDDRPLYEIIAEHVARWGENVGVVVGATYRLKKVRKIVGDMPILIPGIGAQGGDITNLKEALDSKGEGIIVSSSRSIIFSDNPREATEKLSKQIREATG